MLQRNFSSQTTIEELPIRLFGMVRESIVDGRYIEEKRDLDLRFRGSTNQRILDVTC